MAEDTAVGAATPALLEASDDLYDGKIVNPAALPSDPAAFRARLAASLAAWRAGGVHGVWLRLGLAQSPLVPVAAEEGFVFHHAEKDYVMMTQWLPTDLPCTLPPNASHQVGVGAFVVDGQGRVLVVQERSGVLRGRGVWKMPTGLVSSGEDLTEAAERELREETGVEARVEAVLAVRQMHGAAFGKSDLFVVLGMRPTAEGQEPVPCERELVAAAWLPLTGYTDQAFFAGMPLYQTLLERCQAWAEGRYSGMRAERLESSITRKRHDLLVWGVDDAELGRAREALGGVEAGAKPAEPGEGA
ncbi:hypothetical protein HYH03_018225 [Edaphochlamys debaryana]|uniref:Nudix hydrolase domain-containing protein n=1 Tax=Edaphochlamys debaryana TaxID=47281 RepID=A0A835XE75_9CHLO|nr:hypothetical protein HYH03_018225 [Edaphochlamys debaryana]|eukprot:KAG2482882.1 hypothetical protein HYH03_018225 [Edaphochlamys debaryana]